MVQTTSSDSSLLAGQGKYEHKNVPPACLSGVKQDPHGGKFPVGGTFLLSSVSILVSAI